jgi:hypothetical protein
MLDFGSIEGGSAISCWGEMRSGGWLGIGTRLWRWKTKQLENEKGGKAGERRERERRT